MPYVLLLGGGAMFVSGVRNTEGDLWTLIRNDFTGSRSFLVWIAAIAIVGGAGYIKPLKGLSVAFMTLLLIVLFLSNKGIVAQFAAFGKKQNSGGNIPAGNTTGATGITPLQPLQALTP